MMVDDQVITLKERINGCMRRSMNGKDLPEDSRRCRRSSPISSSSAKVRRRACASPAWDFCRSQIRPWRLMPRVG